MNMAIPGIDPGEDKPDKLRTKTGDLKAIQWFCIEHQLKSHAIGAYPSFYFTDREGQEVRYNVRDIVAEYREFKGRTYGKRQQAA